MLEIRQSAAKLQAIL